MFESFVLNYGRKWEEDDIPQSNVSKLVTVVAVAWCVSNMGLYIVYKSSMHMNIKSFVAFQFQPFCR